MSYLGSIQQAIVARAPHWITRGPGGVFLQALGATLDVAQASLLHAMRQTRPLTAFEDALSYLGADRGIRRYPTEPVESYRMRLAQWRQIKRHAGSHYGQLLSLQPYFLPGTLPTIRIVHQSGDGSFATWHTMSSAGVYSVSRVTPTNFRYDGLDSKWSRFWVLIYETPSLHACAKYGDGTTYGDGSTVYGGALTAAQAADIVSIVNDSKAAHSVLWGVIYVRGTTVCNPAGAVTVLPDGSTTLPFGNWGDITDGTTGFPTRPQDASFIYDAGVHIT